MLKDIFYVNAKENALFQYKKWEYIKKQNKYSIVFCTLFFLSAIIVQRNALLDNEKDVCNIKYRKFCDVIVVFYINKELESKVEESNHELDF